MIKTWIKVGFGIYVGWHLGECLNQVIGKALVGVTARKDEEETLEK